MSLTKVTSGAITDSAITTAKIEDGTIVNADINASANIAQSKLSLSLPTISSISIENSQGAIPPSDTSLYFDIIGTNFSNPSTVELLDSSTNASTNATTVTYVSATQLRVTASLSAGTYKIRVTRSDGFAGISATALLTVSQAVSWSTSAGSLGTFDEGLAISTITLSATSNSSVTYAIQSGSLPTGLSLNTSNGEITGTPGSIAADTTSTFTVRATDAESQFADREFNITVTNIVIFQSLRFNDDDSPYLSKTPSASNRKTWTFSTWVKRSDVNTSSVYLGVGTASTDMFQILLQNDGGANKLIIQDRVSGTNNCNLQTSQAIRDPSAWYHIVVAADSTDATDSNRVKVYINGSQVTDFSTETYPSQDYQFHVNNNIAHHIGSQSKGGTGDHFDGHLAEVHFIDGTQKQASDFGETGSNGRWKPKTYSGTYGTNGFYLDFADSGNLGDDESGNTNDFTANNLGATDQVTDNPQNNFATLSSIDAHTTSPTLAEGNLDFTGVSGTAFTPARSTIAVSSGKWYMEYKFKTAGGGVGVMTTQSPINDHLRDDSDVRSLYRGHNGYYFGRNNSGAIDDVGDNSQTFSADDIGMIALDLDNGYVYFGKNGTWLYGQDGSTTGVPTSGSSGTGSANHSSQLLTDQHDGVWGFMAYDISSATTGNVIANFGNIPSTVPSPNSDANGYGKFYYAPPSGYLALCTNNLPEPTIKDSSEYFNTVLYTGDGTSQSITGVGFQPDFVWIKERSSTSDHHAFDSVRGVNKVLFPSNNNAESTSGSLITSFDSDGFTHNGAGGIGENSQTYVAWNWLANGGTTSSNTDGSITSTVQANTTAGFSVVTYTGTGTAGTIGHGLGKKPQCIILKNRSFNDSWITFHEPEGATKFMSLDTTGASSDFGAMWNDTEPTTSVFSIGSDSGGRWVNSSGDTYVAYCFAGIEGYSKFGSYIGNGNADGTFVYTGFKPAFVMVKRTDSTNNWNVFDNKRDIDNQVGNVLYANLNDAEGADAAHSSGNDFLSNGFKLRETGNAINGSGASYFYMAFAESPFGGILTNEATAR